MRPTWLCIKSFLFIFGVLYVVCYVVCNDANNMPLQKVIPLKDITCVRKAKTAGVFPNAIEITSWGKKVRKTPRHTKPCYPDK